MTKQQYRNRPFADSFAAFRQSPQSHQHIGRLRTDSVLPAVKNWEGDGVDHINTHHHADTELGKALSMYGDYEFNHNKYGRFRTIHGLVSWLANPNQPDEYRTMTAFKVQQIRQSKVQDQYIPDFHHLIVDATWQKIKAYPELKKVLAESTLPFDYYYYNFVQGENGKDRVRIRNNSSRWLIAGFEELRKAAREDREPDLSFIDRNNTSTEQRQIDKKPSNLTKFVNKNVAERKGFKQRLRGDANGVVIAGTEVSPYLYGEKLNATQEVINLPPVLAPYSVESAFEGRVPDNEVDKALAQNSDPVDKREFTNIWVAEKPPVEEGSDLVPTPGNDAGVVDHK